MSDSRLHIGRIVVTCTIIFLIVTSNLGLVLAQTSVVWDDDFNDGDFEGWVIEGGLFSIVNNSLACNGFLRWPDVATIFHESQGAFGNWSFDIKGYTPSVWFIASSPNHRNVSGYRFARVVNEENTHYFGLYRVLNGQETRIAQSTLTNNTDWEIWHHVEVERGMDGLFTINVNGTQIISIVDANISTSNYFVFGVYSPGGWLDNVEVNSFVIPDTTSQEPDEYILLLYSFAALILLTGVILFIEIRRRRR